MSSALAVNNMVILKPTVTNPSCARSAGVNTIPRIARNPGTHLPRVRYATALTPLITKDANTIITYCESKETKITDLIYTQPFRCPPPHLFHRLPRGVKRTLTPTLSKENTPLIQPTTTTKAIHFIRFEQNSKLCFINYCKKTAWR